MSQPISQPPSQPISLPNDDTLGSNGLQLKQFVSNLYNYIDNYNTTQLEDQKPKILDNIKLNAENLQSFLKSFIEDIHKVLPTLNQNTYFIIFALNIIKKIITEPSNFDNIKILYNYVCDKKLCVGVDNINKSD